MSGILRSGYVKWDGLKYIVDTDIESVQGNTGPQGPAGVIGPIGARGDTGPIGVGNIGDPGPRGPAGPTGIGGAAFVGPMGATGPIGTASTDPGPIGVTGPVGLIGNVGLVGPIGPTIMGPQGHPSGPETVISLTGPTIHDMTGMTAGNRANFLICVSNGITNSAIVTTIKLPSPSIMYGAVITVIDIDGTLTEINKITLHRYGAESIDGIPYDGTDNFHFTESMGRWVIASDGSNWFIQKSARFPNYQIFDGGGGTAGSIGSWSCPYGVKYALFQVAGGGGGGGGGGAANRFDSSWHNGQGGIGGHGSIAAVVAPVYYPNSYDITLGGGGYRGNAGVGTGTPRFGLPGGQGDTSSVVDHTTSSTIVSAVGGDGGDGGTGGSPSSSWTRSGTSGDPIAVVNSGGIAGTSVGGDGKYGAGGGGGYGGVYGVTGANGTNGGHGGAGLVIVRW
jgi:hypothetical protein